MTTLTLHQQAVQRIRDLLASNEGAIWTRTEDLLADIMHFCTDDKRLSKTNSNELTIISSTS